MRQFAMQQSIAWHGIEGLSPQASINGTRSIRFMVARGLAGIHFARRASISKSMQKGRGCSTAATVVESLASNIVKSREEL
jgi:hypothetical protein